MNPRSCSLEPSTLALNPQTSLAGGEHAKEKGEAMLGFMDNLGSQTAGPFKGLLKNQGIAPHFLPPGTTDNTQIVDGGFAFSHKHLTNQERDDWMLLKTGRPGASDDEINADRISTSKKDATGGVQHVSASELRVLVTHWACNAWTKLCEGGGEGRS